MEITLRHTDKIVELNGIPARIWEGQTANGIPIHAFITRIAVLNGDDQTQFEAELQVASAPSVAVQAIPLRLLI
jgi:hypothetical protein